MVGHNLCFYVKLSLNYPCLSLLIRSTALYKTSIEMTNSTGDEWVHLYVFQPFLQREKTFAL